MEDKTRGRVVVIIGKSGSGKSTVARLLTDEYGVVEVKSNTTRKPRGGNENYHFMTEDDYAMDCVRGKVVESAMFDENRYWSTVNYFEGNNPLVMITEPHGAQQLKDNLKDKEVIRVYLTCDTDECYRRMMNRGDSSGDILRRINHDSKYFQMVNCDIVMDVTHLTPEEVAEKIAQFI